MNKKILMIFIPIIAVIVAAIGILSYIALSSPSADLYLEQVRDAQRFLQEGDVDMAIVYYRNAIEQDNTRTDAYLGLAELYYLSKNDLDAAIQVLRDGYNVNHSEELMDAIKYYTGLRDGGESFAESNTVVPAEKGTVSAAYMDAFSTYTYMDYIRRCTMTSEHNYTSAYTIAYSQFDAEFEYKNTDATPDLREKSNGKPQSGARPTLIRVNHVGSLIAGVENGVTAEDLKAQGAKNIDLKKPKGEFETPYLTFTYADCTISVACDEDGVIHEDSAPVIVEPPVGTTKKSDKTVVSGQVLDAVSNGRINGAELMFRSGSDNKSGSAAAKATSKNGNYRVELAPGSYTVEVGAEGYITEFFDLDVPEDEEEMSRSFVLSPKLEENQMRFVVEWSNMQSDLYIHIKGTNSKNERVEFWEYGSKSANSGESIDGLENGTSGGKRFTAATITDSQGSYEFHVHGGKNQYDKDQLLSADVVVKVYKDNTSSPIVLNIPDSFPLKYWVVCSVHDGEIHPID